jgi:hypothetical protein
VQILSLGGVRLKSHALEFTSNGSRGKWNNRLGGPLRGTPRPTRRGLFTLRQEFALKDRAAKQVRFQMIQGRSSLQDEFQVTIAASKSGLSKASPHRFYGAGAGTMR